MGEDKQTSRLHIVRAPQRTPIAPDDFRDPRTQGTLFPSPRQGLLVFVYFPEVTEDEFRYALEYAKPSYVLELRSAPRFDIGTLNRQSAFGAFERQQARYLDLTSTFMGKIDMEGAIGSLQAFLSSNRPKIERPIMFLVSRSEINEQFTRRIYDAVTISGAAVSEIYEI